MAKKEKVVIATCAYCSKQIYYGQKVVTTSTLWNLMSGHDFCSEKCKRAYQNK